MGPTTPGADGTDPPDVLPSQRKVQLVLGGSPDEHDGRCQHRAGRRKVRGRITRCGCALVLGTVLVLGACQANIDDTGERGTETTTAPSSSPDSVAPVDPVHDDTVALTSSRAIRSMSEKFDAPLRMKLRELENAGREDAQLSVFVETVDDPSDEQRDRLSEAGLRVRSVAGHIVTATGPPGAIRQVAGFDYVASMSLSQTRPALR